MNLVDAILADVITMDDVPSEESDTDDEMSAVAVKKRKRQVGKNPEMLGLQFIQNSESDEEFNQKQKFKANDSDSSFSSQSD